MTSALSIQRLRHRMEQARARRDTGRPHVAFVLSGGGNHGDTAWASGRDVASGGAFDPSSIVHASSSSLSAPSMTLPLAETHR